MSRVAPAVRMTPQVSYFSPQGDGRGGIKQVTRQILGRCEQQASSESSFIVTATVR